MADEASRAGHGYATHAVLDYLERVHVRRDDAIQRATETPARTGIAPIHISSLEGVFLSLVMRLAGARKVVEIGTLAGVSALHIVRALPPDGHLWTLEVNPTHAAAARENFNVAGVADRVTVVEGTAVSTLPTLERHGPFDAVFIDADKWAYDTYAKWAAQHLRPGGLLLADNALFFGRLTDTARTAAAITVDGHNIPAAAVSAGAAAMRRFHEYVSEHFDSTCLATPEGLVVAIRR